MLVGRRSPRVRPHLRLSPWPRRIPAKAKTVLDQAIQALGGDAYLNIQEISQQGRTYSFHHGETTSTGILFWRFVKFPDKERIEVTKQRDVAYVYNGDQPTKSRTKAPPCRTPRNHRIYPEERALPGNGCCGAGSRNRELRCLRRQRFGRRQAR